VKLYLTPTELNMHPIGLALSGPVAQVQAAATGALDNLLSQASELVDSFCGYRLGKPGSSVITGGVTAGALSLTVDSTLTLDSGDEQAIIVGTGPSAEIIPLEAGGVQVSSLGSPYPGTLSLAFPVQQNHPAGTPVQFCYQEISQAGSTSIDDPFTEAFLSQQAQIARGHAIGMMLRGLTRTVFLRAHPLGTVYAVAHSYSYNNEFVDIDPSTLILEPKLGYYRFELGQVITPKGMIKTTYTAGFQALPATIKTATAYYFASLLQPFFNMMGAMESSEGKVRYKWTDGKSPQWYVQQAEDILLKGQFKHSS
jgi:hypothetical protein